MPVVTTSQQENTRYACGCFPLPEVSLHAGGCIVIDDGTQGRFAGVDRKRTLSMADSVFGGQRLPMTCRRGSI